MQLKKNLLEHIIVFNSLSSNYLLLFSLHFKKILKIFFCLRKDFGYEEYENMLMDYFLPYFPSEQFEIKLHFKINIPYFVGFFIAPMVG